MVSKFTWFRGFKLRIDVYLPLIIILVFFSSGGCDNPSAKERQSKRLTAEKIGVIWHEKSVLAKEADPNSGGMLTLERAIRQALSASPALSQVRYRIEAAGQQVLQAEAAFYPRLVLSQDFNATDNPVYGMMHIINQRRLQGGTNFNSPGWQHNYGTLLKTDVTLFDAGTRSYGRDAALSQRRAQESELQVARNQLVGSVIGTYYRWLQAMGFTEVAERALAQANTNEKLGQARVEAQRALPSELLRLKSRTAQSQSNLVSAKMSTRRFQAALERLLARNIGGDETPDFKTFARPPAESPVDANSLTKRALENRPEIQAILYLVQGAQNRVKSVKGSSWPTVSAFAQYELDSERVRRFDDSWMFGAQASWPLFEGGLTRARVREAQAKFQEIQARGVELTLDIALEVQQACLGLEEAKQKVIVSEEQKKWSEKALAETQRHYQQEIVTVEAILQAQLEWNQAETGYTAAIFDYRIAQALLRQAIGGYADWIELNHP
ncbi:MAG: TolC family protein [Phycisphaerae bacterium]|nr:TolC family protein [Phycisphaerae bacterium]